MFGRQHGRAPQYFDRLLSTNPRCGVTAAPSFSQVVQRHRLSTHGSRVLLLLARWSGTLFLTISGRRYYRELQALIENVSVFSVPVQLAH